MKFGEYLRKEKVPEWQYSYLDYDKLKDMIRQLEERHLFLPQANSKGTSLSIPRPTNAAGMPDEVAETVNPEQFYNYLEQEMRKIEQFTKKKVQEIREVLSNVESRLQSEGRVKGPDADALTKMVEKAGDDFLKLEKYVNLNFTGFHKILKKHDRRLPNPCKAFYTARLHDQSWVRGDYSDVIVAMSRVYSALRGDVEVIEKEAERQDFVRSTRKYWVQMENITAVKHMILQHLPVFLQKSMDGETDSQLVNSVYIDNHSMELYHGRLDKSPGAIALRFRWYGTGIPDTVFVERKTHRESWAGEVSVKERFSIKENQVLPLLAGKFDLKSEITRMQAKGKSEADIQEWNELASEVCQQINSKQLVPTMRTQYMRTAFQVPFDATVRISLDTNLCMILERTKETQKGERWYRDPRVTLPLNEITRFPHGVLEIKLQLQEEGKTPFWVTELLNSGMLMEVHKFSKFIHGCAVLIPEDLRAVPYWIDDESLKESITDSGGAKLLETSSGANEYYPQLLPHEKDGKLKGDLKKLNPRRADTSVTSVSHASIYNPQEMDSTDNCITDVTDRWCEWASPYDANHVTAQKVEPKLFFANERTFIKWLNMAVIISSISIGVLAFSPHDGDAQFFAVMMLPIALLFIAYSLWTFLWRSQKIRTRDVNRWDDPVGPVFLTVCIIVALTVQFFIKLSQIVYDWVP